MESLHALWNLNMQLRMKNIYYNKEKHYLTFNVQYSSIST